MTEESIKKYLEDNYDEDAITQDVDEAIPDFLDDDWEDDFDYEHEAYEETGRGEAEAQVRTEIESDILGKLGVDYFEFDKFMGKTISDIIHEVYPTLDK